MTRQLDDVEVAFEAEVAGLRARIEVVEARWARYREMRAWAGERLPVVLAESVATTITYGGRVHYWAPFADGSSYETWCGYLHPNQRPGWCLPTYGLRRGVSGIVTCRICWRWIARGFPRDPRGRVLGRPPTARDGD